MKKMRRTKPPRERATETAYCRLWRLVDGAIVDTIANHPEYFRKDRLPVVRTSIAKRVVGAILGHAEQSARGRSGEQPATDTGIDAALAAAFATGGMDTNGVAQRARPVRGERAHRFKDDARDGTGLEPVPSQFSLHNVVTA